MSIGSWDPSAANDGTPFEFDRALLKRVIALVADNQGGTIAEAIAPAERQSQARMMTLPKEQWFAEAEHYSDEEIGQLIRFFTLAEMQIPGWEAGEKSPVIWLVKVLRKRGNPIGRELQLWIRANSNNRFLPNGPL